MYTSDTEKDLRTSLVYMLISIFLAAAGAVYEHFSFGVYSYYMIYAFAIPLIGGSLPFMIKAICGAEKAAFINDRWYHAAVGTLTAGCFVHGALCICGRPNSLVLVYPAAAAALAVFAMIRCACSESSRRRGRQEYRRLYR